jgi:hypothetical protein
MDDGGYTVAGCRAIEVLTFCSEWLSPALVDAWKRAQVRRVSSTICELRWSYDEYIDGYYPWPAKESVQQEQFTSSNEDGGSDISFFKRGCRMYLL